MRNRFYIIALLVVVVISAALMASLLFAPADELYLEPEEQIAEQPDEIEPEPAVTTVPPPPVRPRAPPTERNTVTGTALHGIVTSTSGQPIAADVIVAAPSMGNPKRARAGSDGRYKVLGLPKGPLTIAVRARGFRPVRVNNFNVDGPTEKSFTMEPISGVVGRVIAPDGRAARGAWVRLSHSDGQRTIRSDAEGRFSWDKPGIDLSSITAIAYSPWHGSSERVAPKADEELVLRLTDGAVIEGRVIDQASQPVVGAAVAIDRCKGDPNHEFTRRFWPPTRTNKEGRFRIERARPGSCDLTADSSNHAIGRAEGVWTSSGNTTDNVTITLGSGGVVRGRVTMRGKGSPISGARVVLFEPGSNLPPASARTDRDGAYKLEGVAPGRHSVRVQHPKFLTELRGGVEVPDGGEVQRDFELRQRKSGEKFAFQGIGATLGRSPNGVVIRKTMPGSPASKFGLKDGDVILSVDHQPMAGKGISSVVESIRGEAGTPVSIEVNRKGQGRITISVERGDVIVK